MNFETTVQFLSLEQRMIRKGERAGQGFYIVRFLVDVDVIELMIFDQTELLNKLLKLQKFQEVLAEFKITQPNGNTKLNLVDIA